MHIVAKSNTWLRLPMLVVAVAGFAVLYLAARRFDGNYGLLGLSDEAVRRFAHFVVYGGLALLTAKALFNEYLLAGVLSVLLATGEEIHQLFVPYRFASMHDWAINMAGVSTFLLTAYALGHLSRFMNQPVHATQ